MQMPVSDEPIPRQVGHRNKRQAELSEREVRLGVLGTTVMIVAGVGVRYLVGRKLRRRKQLTPKERGLIKQLIAHGEMKRWDFSYDEDFIFKFLPVLKTIVR